MIATGSRVVASYNVLVKNKFLTNGHPTACISVNTDYWFMMRVVTFLQRYQTTLAFSHTLHDYSQKFAIGLGAKFGTWTELDHEMNCGLSFYTGVELHVLWNFMCCCSVYVSLGQRIIVHAARWTVHGVIQRLWLTFARPRSSGGVLNDLLA